MFAVTGENREPENYRSAQILASLPIARATRPTAVVLENPGGLMSLSSSSTGGLFRRAPAETGTRQGARQACHSLSTRCMIDNLSCLLGGMVSLFAFFGKKMAVKGVCYSRIPTRCCFGL